MHDEENTEGGRPAQSDGPPAAYCAYCPRPVAAPAPHGKSRRPASPFGSLAGSAAGLVGLRI